MWDFIKKMILSRGSQLASRYIAVWLVFLAGKAGANIPSDQITGSAEVLGTILAGLVLLLVDIVIHTVRGKTETESEIEPAKPYSGPLILALCALPLFMLSGCGVDQRAVKASAQGVKHIENGKKNSGILTEQIAVAYETEAKAHIDTKYRWDAEKVVTQAKANPAITPQQIVDEMLFKTWQRDQHRAYVELQRTKALAVQSVVNKDLDNAVKINAKLTEYLAEPGFDFVAFVQGIFGKKEDELPPDPQGANTLPAEIIKLPEVKEPPK